MATVTMLDSPFKYSPVSAPLWYQVSSASSSVTDFKYLFDVYEINQSNNSVLSDMGRYLIPPSPSGTGLFTPNKIVNAVVTNDCNYNATTFIQATASIVQYRVQYGFQYNPGLTFASTFDSSGSLGLSFSTAHGLLTDDYIMVNKNNKSVNAEYDGSQEIISTTSTNVVLGASYGVSLANESGVIDLLTRVVGTASDAFGYNGTRQYLQRTFDFGSPSNYLMASTSSKFLSTFESRIGREYPIFSDQYQSVSFLADTMSYSLPTYFVNTYDSNYTLLNDYQLTGLSSTNYHRWDGPSGIKNLEPLGVSFSGASYYNVGFSLPGSNQDVIYNGAFFTSSGWTFSISPGNNSLGINLDFGLGFLGNSFSVATASQIGVLTPGQEYYGMINLDINVGTDVYLNGLLMTTGLTGSFDGYFTASSANLNIQFNPGTHTPPLDIHTANIQSLQVLNLSVTPNSNTFKWFKIVENCCLYENFQLVFLNRMGGMDYWNFNKQHLKKLNISREEYRRVLPWDYSVGDRGFDLLSVDADEVFQINSDWLTDYESNFLQEILTSQQVFYIDSDDNLIPIIITDSSYQIKRVLRDQLFNLQLNFKLANKLNLFDL